MPRRGARSRCNAPCRSKRSEERRVGKECGARETGGGSSRRRHTRYIGDWSSDVCSSDLKITTPVDVAPGQDPGPDVRVVVGVTEARFIEPDFGSRPPGAVRGDATPRRAVQMQCTVSLEARAVASDRVLQMKTLDDALYALDDGAFRSGSVFVDPNDPAKDLGFLIQEL